MKLAQHIMAMADDAHFVEHPEWGEIVKEAKEVLGISDVFRFIPVSPDGIPCCLEDFATESEAYDYLQEWVQRFKQQGYYSTGEHERIPYNATGAMIYARCKVISYNAEEED
jgi:hypothetical protein